MEDPSTRELTAAHDVLAEFYAERLAGLLVEMPIEQAVLGLFCQLVRGNGGEAPLVCEVGAGSGRLAPYLVSKGVQYRGIDLSQEMVRVARRDYPGNAFDVGDVRRMPYGDATLDGVLGWYSLMYLSPDHRKVAFAEIARTLRPGGQLAMAFKAGDDTLRRAGKTLDLGIEFDIYWLSPDEVQRCVAKAGLEVVFWVGRPADPDELQPQGYLLARKPKP